MAEQSAISWTDATFNPWIGCTKVSPACANCYAERDFDRRKHVAKWGDEGTRVMTSPANWKKPHKWNELAGMGVCLACHPTIKMDGTRRPCSVCNSTGKLERRPRIFCASLADVFEDWTGLIVDSRWFTLWRDQVGGETFALGEAKKLDPENAKLRYLTMDDVRRDLFAMIDATPNLDWLLLTKRPENIARMWCSHVNTDGKPPSMLHRSNAWLGTSVENQAYAKRIGELLKCRDLASVLFLSCEPLLGSIEFSDVAMRADAVSQLGKKALSGIDWVIAGGESGPNARSSHPDWFRSLRDQCEAVGVPFHFKQWGEHAPLSVLDQCSNHSEASSLYAAVRIDGKPARLGETAVYRVGVKQAGRLLDGVLHDAFPAVQGAGL